MKILLEDYQGKLKTVNEMVEQSKLTNNGSINDTKRQSRLETKASEYRSMIVDIERAIARGNPKPKHDDSKSWQPLSFKTLMRGNIVRNIISRNTYLVDACYDNRATAVNILDINNEKEWEILR